MKVRNGEVVLNHIVRCSAYTLAAFCLALSLGCTTDKTLSVDHESDPLSIRTILVGPRSPSPEDTVTISVIVENTRTEEDQAPDPGNYVTTSWEVSHGSLLDDQGLSVTWIAPETQSVCEIRVTVSNGASSTTRTKHVFVGARAEPVSERAGEISLWPFGGGFYYLYSAFEPNDTRFSGFTISVHDGSSNGRVTNFLSGIEYVFSENQQYASFTRETNFGGGVPQAQHVLLVNLLAGSTVQVTSDGAHPFNDRRHEYSVPSFSPNQELLAYQAFRPGPEVGATDSFDIFVSYPSRPLDEPTRVTETHGQKRNNFYPSFSTDGQWLVFLSDRSGPREWELYGVPVGGGTVPTDSSSVERLTNSGGSISQVRSSMTRPDKPLMAWNPVQPILGVRVTNGNLVIADTNNPTVSHIVSIANGAKDLSWSNSGNHLAVSSGREIFLIDATYDKRRIHEAEAGDIVTDVTWSANDAFIAFRVTRLNSTWVDVLDVSGNLGVQESISITPRVPKASLNIYATIMSTRPTFDNMGRLFILFFDRGTPWIASVDLSTVMGSG